jgi:predicted SprT family Zn-dependent metalloprotease
VEQLALPLDRRRRPRPRPSERPTAALARLARAMARRLGRDRGLTALEVVFNRRLRSSAGRVDFGARRIELNPRLLDRNPRELVPTLAHELCHLLAGARAGHGSRWKRTMVELGFEPVACHRLDVAGLALRRRSWRWLCPRCGESYERGHRRAHRYACGRCGAGLRLAGPVAATRP